MDRVLRDQVREPVKFVPPRGVKGGQLAADLAKQALAQSKHAPPTRAPPHTKVYPPSAFSEAWSGRPTSPTKIGFRLVSEDAIEIAMGRALLAARDAMRPPDALDVAEARVWREAYEANVMAEILIHALCQPDDVTKPYFSRAPNTVIRIALPPLTLQAMWEEFELLTVSMSPLAPEATEDELGALLDQLGEIVGLPLSRERSRALRIARMLLDECGRVVR
jgi:hypothetical protein